MKNFLKIVHYKIVISFLNLKKFSSNFYQNILAGYISKYFFFLYIPLDFYISINNYKIIRPMPKGPGELLPSIDLFIRRLEKNKKLKKKKFIFISQKFDNYLFVEKYLNNYFYKIIFSDFIYMLLLPLMLKNKSYVLEIGVGATKWNIKSFHKKKYNHNKFYHQEKNYFFANQLKKYQKILFKNQNGFENLNFKVSENLEKKINFNKRIILVHIKSEIVNATGKSLDFSTYLKLLNYLKKSNFFIILIGRDKLPKEFHDFIDLNYANSSDATFENDLALTKICYASIYNASGIFYASTVMNKPFLYINSWHNFNIPSMSKNHVVEVPALVNFNDNKLTFKEQIELYEKIYNSDQISDSFPSKTHSCVNASADEIINGFLELEHVIENQKKLQPTKLQLKIKELMYKNRNIYKTNSLISDYFLKHNEDRF